MSETQETKVDTRFEKWYQVVDLDENRERIVARWKGIEDLYFGVSTENIHLLCQLAFGDSRRADQALAWFEKGFKQFDESFSIKSNDEELRILAAACIVNELENAEPGYEDIYMAIAGANFFGQRKFAVSFDINNLVEYTLTRLSRAAAVRPALGQMDNTPFLFEANVHLHWDSNREAALKNMANSINVKLDAIQSKVEKLDTVIQVQDDELQILWWLFNGKSIEQNVPFSKVKAESRPLIFAKEMADFISTPPGPASIAEIFAKAGVSNTGKLKIIDAIASVPDWGLTLDGEEIKPSPLLHPLHYALSLQAQALTGWQQYWAGSVKVSIDAELPPLALAQQFYRERLQLRSV